MGTSGFTGFPKDGVAWFQGLALAQDREWFQAHRADYERLWRQPLEALVAELPGPLKKVHGRAIGTAKVFRLNRDVRFSKDKSPYKTHVSVVFPFEGFDPMQGPAALYFHLGLEDLVAFGFYMLEPAGLKALREALLDEKKGRAVQALVDEARTAGLQPDSMERLERAPRGVDPAHPRIELLRHKGLALSRADIPKGVRYVAAFKDFLLEQAAHAAPLVKWGLKEGLAR